MPGVLFYNPLAVAALAEHTKVAADELATLSTTDSLCDDAVSVAHTIAGDLEQTLGSTLHALLTNQSMSQWNSIFGPSIDDFIAQLTTHATDSSGRFFLDEGEFTLATSISTTSPSGSWHDAVYGVSCVAFPGGTYAGGGFITDHLGASYPIVVPRIETDEGDVYTADLCPTVGGEPSVATLGGTDPGWEVVGVATGVERFQAVPSTADQLAGFFAGSTGLVVPRPPNSALVYIEPGLDGGPPHLTGAPVIAATGVAPPAAGAPDPADSSPPAIAEGAAALIITTAQGAVMAAAMDNQTHRAYQVIFEENADGRRRARIQTFTLAADGDGDGDVSIIPEHVYLDGDGTLTSQTISYGSPYGTAGDSIVATDDVAGFALSGRAPIEYAVPDATFP